MKVLTGIIAAALLLVPATASAHHSTDIDQSADCATGLTVTVDYSDFGGGHVLRVETTYDGHTHTADRTPTGTGTLTLRYGSFSGTGPVHIEAWAVDEQPVHQTDDYDYTLHCKPPVIHGPLARISPACGDPMIRWTLIARSKPTTFTITATSFLVGRHTWTATVAAHSRKVSSYHHLLGGSRVTIRANGKVLATKLVEPAGQYGRCPL